MTDLHRLIAAEIAQPIDPRVAAMAAAIAARHGAASRAVLFYGSCLRQSELDGLMLDFYLIVSDYASAYPQRWLAIANALLPPNVFPFEHDGLIAKYAVLSEADFARLASSCTRNVSVWARFAQPSRLAWACDDAARTGVVDAIAGAAPALLGAALCRIPADADPLDLWRGAFALTYAAELRAERGGRAQSVVDAEPARYRAFTAPALAQAERQADQWRRRVIEGKLLTIARLAKASLTYAGGIDYLAWKINRHAGTRIEIRPWQRRWPLLGAISLLPRLLRSGAVR